ncbi:MAG TPA: right-handed parallel beta-helix repeat-containing protein [Opitutaceae bacterium]|nr:right-handed parallel beta-helix repeat-containing protein [Opitutaceae bacterium]
MFLRKVRHLLLAVALGAVASAADVKSLGAKGDGQADDTAAIQKAVDAGGAVQFTTGTYKITRTVTIDLDKTGFIALRGDSTVRVVMAGAGPAFLFIGTHAGSAAPAQFKPNVWERQRTPAVEGFEIVGAHLGADGIAARGTVQLTITRIVVREARHAIHLIERNRNVLISDVHLYHNRGIGIFYDAVNLHQSNITGSHISYNAGGGVVVRGGDVRNIQIGNCDIESNMEAGTPATANVLIDSANGSVGEVAITGCTIQHTAAGPDSANIRIIGVGVMHTTTTDKTPTNEGHVTITGNVLSDVQVNVHLKAVRGATLTGNTFWMGFAHDLVVEDSSNVVVGPNNLDRNPRYAYTQRNPSSGVVFRRSRDCTITGLHVNGVREHEAAVVFEDCTRFNATNGTILDSDGVGLRLKNTSLSRVSGWLIRDDRGANSSPAIQATGGEGNQIIGNTLDRAAQIAGSGTIARDNEVVIGAKR